jgi:hypothetical protein
MANRPEDRTRPLRPVFGAPIIGPRPLKPWPRLLESEGKVCYVFGRAKENPESEATDRILAEVSQKIASIHGKSVCGVYPFGTYARDEAGEKSVLDILIVPDQVES